MKSKELIASYFNSQLTEAEERVRVLQQHIRHREIGVNDSYELQYALVKHEVLKQVIQDVSVFLKIDDIKK